MQSKIALIPRWLLAVFLIVSMATAVVIGGEPQLRFEPAPAPAKKQPAPPAIPSNSTGLEKPVKPSVLYASSNGKRWLIVTREFAVKRGSNRCWRVTLDAKIGADWVISELQTDPFDGSAPMPSPMLGAESSYSWSATFDESQAKRLCDHKRESIRVDVNLVPRAGPSPDHEKAFEYLKSHPDAVRVEHSVDANKMVPVPPPQFQPPHDEPKLVPVLPRQHTPDATAKPQAHSPASLNKPFVKFHHCRKECKPCPKAYSWMWHLGPKSINATIVFMEYENPNEAGANGVPFVPSLELNGNFIGFDPDHKNHKKHGKNACCPDCVNDWIKRGGKVWPPENAEFDEPAADQRVAAAGVVGASSARVVVQQAIEMIKTRIGVGVPFGLVWDRNGKQQLPLLHNQDFSLEAVLGTSGEFTVSAKGAKNLPVKEFWLRYKDVGDRYELTFGTTVKKPSSKAPAASAQTVGVIDPASLSMLFSLGNALWSVLHPQADITLGGRVSITCILTGDTLGIDFKDCPLLHFHMMADFLFGVRRAELAADKCRVLFLPQNFWAKWVPFVPKERTILIN